MECDMCGSDENLVRVKNELGESIYLCQGCYDIQHDGYSKSEENDLDEDDLEALEEEKLDKLEGEGRRKKGKASEDDVDTETEGEFKEDEEN